MAQRIETIGLPATERPTAIIGTLPGPGARLPVVQEESDPGIAWVAGTPAERASAELTMRDLLAIWRSAERLLETIPESDAARYPILQQISALRAAYQRLFAVIRRTLLQAERPARGDRRGWDLSLVPRAARHATTAGVTEPIAAARPSTIRSSSSSVMTNGGPSRIESPFVPSARPVPE